MNSTISHRINETWKQKSSMSKKYLYSCSSCTNVNIFLEKHIIEDSMHYSDRIIQFKFLFIHDTLQECKSRKAFTGHPKENYHFTFCLIFQKPKSRITNCFFLLKAEIHTQILKTRPITCDTRGLKYLLNKIGFLNT